MPAKPAPSTNNSTIFLDLESGRRMAIEEYGDRTGQPMFFFHGWPSSRWQGAMLDAAGRELGFRLLALDRPGMGDSDFQPDRRLTDFPPLLSEIADRLELSRFHVFGVSGGGPYALVSAWALPRRVIACAVCCGAPPLADRTDTSSLLPVYRWLLAMYRRRPEVMRRVFRMVRPVATIRPPGPMWRALKLVLPRADALALNDRDTMERAWRGYAGSWKGNPDAVFADASIYAQPWGFDPAEITIPVRLWHGTEDHNFSVTLAEELGARIPGCQLRIVEGEGHYSIVINRGREILADFRAENAG
ncbi:MAG: alpha/beta hydrolase [Chthoniobacteraceae bacterium]